MLTNLSFLGGNYQGTFQPAMAGETTLDGEPAGTELIVDPEAPPQGPPPGEPIGKPAEPFHSWTDPTGKVHAFESSDKLNEAMTKSHFLQSDYSKKTDALSGREKQILAREQSLTTQSQKIKEMEGKYSSFRNLMTQRPELFQQFQQMLQQPGTPNEAVAAAQDAMNPMLEEIKQGLADLNKWKDSQSWEKEQTGIHERLATELGDGYNKQEVDNFIASVKDDDPESLFRFAHHALQGQKDPILAQKRAAEQNKVNIQHKGVLPGKGRAPAPKEPQTLDEGREMAAAELS